MGAAKRKVMTIPAKKAAGASAPAQRARKRRVAAYARVSTDKEEQLTSYESQVDFYTRYIQDRDDWEFAGVYADEGITGTSTKRREGFKSMVAAAMSGSIDLIITKSVSRFARNTVDSLTTIRDLKEAGVEVYFEKENIWTFDGKGELLITIMSSLAQEESRSISENCKWGKRKLLAEGHVEFPFSRFLGYDKGPDGQPVVNPEQAKLVRRIYAMFMGGMTVGRIARTLTSEGVKTPGGCDEWQWGTVNSILTNEKYKGDALLQKTFIPDFLNKKQVKNTGQIPQYYVEGNHEAIIEPDLFDAVQREMARRKSLGRVNSAEPFSRKVKCGVCGAWYGRNVWHSDRKSRRYVFLCNDKYKTKPPCPSKRVYEDRLKEVFVSAMNEILPSKKEICKSLRRAIKSALRTGDLEKERSGLLREEESARALVDDLVAENARTPLDQGEYACRYDEAASRCDELAEAIEEIDAEIARRKDAAIASEAFIKAVEEAPCKLDEFDAMLWSALVDHATVHPDESVTVTFKCGIEVKVTA